MLQKDQRGKLFLQVWIDCFLGKENEFSRADLVKNRTLEKLKPYLWQIEAAFGRSQCSNLKKPLKNTLDCLRLWRQMVRVMGGCLKIKRCNTMMECDDGQHSRNIYYIEWLIPKSKINLK